MLNLLIGPIGSMVKDAVTGFVETKKAKADPKGQRDTINSLGIPSVGHFNSTFLLTMFKTPPLFSPGDFS
mgnify:CR=1 FL=1